MNLKKKILIIGGNSFVGRNLLEKLDKSKFEIFFTTRSKKIRKRNHFYLNLLNLDEKNLIIKKKFSIIINCAWSGVLGKYRDDIKQFENIKMSLNVYEIAKKTNCQQLIFFGSQAEYGPKFYMINENSKCTPITKYGKTKLYLYNYFYKKKVTRDPKILWLRLFDTFGPGDNENWVIPYLINSFSKNKDVYLSSCNQKWDFLYIDELCKIIEKLIDKRSFGLYNLASGKSIVLKKIVEYIHTNLNSKSKIYYNYKKLKIQKTHNLIVDTKKLTLKIKYKPIIDVYMGLDLLIKKKICFDKDK